MAQPPPAKRRREDEPYQAASNGYNYPGNHMPTPQPAPVFYPRYQFPFATVPPAQDMIAALSDRSIRGLLADIVNNDPSPYSFAKAYLMDTYTQHIHQQRARVVDFDHYSKDAWYTLNRSHYTKLSSSKQYDAAGDAFDEVVGCINAIAEATNPNSSYGTKLSALETLRKIAKTIVLSDGDCLQSEVRKSFQYDTSLEDAMLAILDSMSDDEIWEAGENVSEFGKPKLLHKLEWVEREAKGCCILESLADVIDRFERANPDRIEGNSTDPEEDLRSDQGDEDEDDEEDDAEAAPVSRASNGQSHVVDLLDD